MACSNGECTITIWKITTGQLIKSLKAHSERITCLAALENERLASGSVDKSVIIWNVDSGKQLNKFQKHKGWITSLAALGDDQIASGSTDNTIRIWNVNKGTELLIISEEHIFGIR